MERGEVVPFVRWIPKKLDDGWPESVEEHSERYMYEDVIISMKHEYKNIR